MSLNKVPHLVFSDGKGNISTETSIQMAGRSGFDIVAMSPDDFIELPEGSDLYELPGRFPVGFSKNKNEPVVFKNGIAVAAQLSPAHTLFYHAAYQTQNDAPTLPLFAYCAVGFLDGKYYVPAMRIDRDVRQEPLSFDQKKVNQNVSAWLKKFPDNRLLHHIGENCALTYHCPAARNFFLNRYEAPIPCSPACNANCIGCISFQPETENIRSTQDRLTFRPTAKEIVEYAVEHLETAPFPVVSFGQGCEGEPLLMCETIRESILEIRKHTQKGSININTNGSMPKAVEELCKAGLNSIRVSLNSVRKKIYRSYYLPNNYAFEALAESIRVVRKYNGWASINYFVFPGMTDDEEEFESLREFIRTTDLTMIQWRNFNIDPDWYFEKIKIRETGKLIGVKNVIEKIRKEFPQVYFGYFNPPMETIRKEMAKRKNKVAFAE